MISHGSMPSSRSGTRSRCTSMPAPSRAISDRADASPAAPQSCSDSTSPRLDKLDRDLDQLLAGERIADLHRRALVRIVLAELLRREHRRAADAVAPGCRAVEDDDIARPVRLRRLQPRRIEDADAHRIDEAVARVRVVEDRRAADVRDADRVAVAADPGDRALETRGRARRTRARRAARSAARPSRRCRAGSRRSRSPRPGRARRRTGGCATRP